MLLAVSLNAQTVDSLNLFNTSKIIQPQHNHLRMGIMGFKDDFMLGLSYNKTMIQDWGLSLKMALWASPLTRDILYQQDSKTYYIFRENRIQILLGMEKLIALSDNIQIHGSASISPVLHFYNGSNRDNMTLSIPVLDFGFTFKAGKRKTTNNNLWIDVGYRFSKELLNRHGFYLMLRIPL